MRKLLHQEIAKERFTVGQLQKLERPPIYVLIDNVRSLYNVGSIFRTSDGARVSKLILTGFTPHPPRKEIEKTALGATQTVPWEYQKDPRAVIANLRSLGVRICLLEHTDSSIPYYAVGKDAFPICLVVGNEITGVSPEIVSQADLAVDIPMFGMKQSLNVAVAYGIVVFDFARKFLDQSK